jgi:putative ABC transport system permease protein
VTVSEADQVRYTDFVSMMTRSVTSIIRVITYVLIASVAISLVVSSLMIGIVTNISVLERTKEIGILRSLGASKRNVSQIFNAENLIIGFCSGALGIFITALLNLPITRIVRNLVQNDAINIALPYKGAVILILVSIMITLLGGFLPARKAAKLDPVDALRTE